VTEVWPLTHLLPPRPEKKKREEKKKKRGGKGGKHRYAAGALSIVSTSIIEREKEEKRGKSLEAERRVDRFVSIWRWPKKKKKKKEGKKKGGGRSCSTSAATHSILLPRKKGGEKEKGKRKRRRRDDSPGGVSSLFGKKEKKKAAGDVTRRWPTRARMRFCARGEKKKKESGQEHGAGGPRTQAAVLSGSSL